MKNYKTLINEVKKVRGSKKESPDFDFIGYKERIDMTDEQLEKYISEKEAYYKECKEVEKHNNEVEIKGKVLINNVKCALYEEIKESLVNVLNKYSNKQLGPATTEKIEKDFEKLTGCKMYIDKSWNYSDYIKIYPFNYNGYKWSYHNDYEITISFCDMEGKDDKKLINEDNRIKKMDITLNNIYCSKNEEKYINNVNKYMRDYIKAYKKMYEMQEKYREEKEKYNSLCIEGLETFSKYDCNVREKYNY
jgi:hypothetical protein